MRKHLGRGHVMDVRDDQQELVTTQAGHGIGTAQHILQAAGCFLQQAVADVMSEGVVNFLETIQVHQ